MQTLFLFPSLPDATQMSFIQALYALLSQYSKNLLRLVGVGVGVSVDDSMNLTNASSTDIRSAMVAAMNYPLSFASFWETIRQQ